MNLYNQKQIRVGSVRCCPICGSTAIEVDILTSAVQNQDGEWTIAKVDSDELQYEVTHPSNQVRCLNPTCGDPYFESSKLRLGELNLFQYFQLFQAMDGNIEAVNRLSDIERMQYDFQEEYELTYEGKIAWQQWADNIDYKPWIGSMEDTIEQGVELPHELKEDMKYFRPERRGLFE
jgi:hypothetical protein